MDRACWLRRSCPTTPRMKSTALRRLSRGPPPRARASLSRPRALDRAGRDRGRGRRDRRRRGGAGARPRRAACPRGCRRGACPSRRTPTSGAPAACRVPGGNGAPGYEAIRSAPASTTSTARPPGRTEGARHRDRPRRRAFQVFPVADDERDRVDRRHRLGERAEETPERALLGLDGEELLEATGERRSSARDPPAARAQGVLWHRRTSGPPAAQEPPPRRAPDGGVALLPDPWTRCGTLCVRVHAQVS